MDREEVSRAYDVEISLRESIQSLTNILFIFEGGSSSMQKNVRYKKVEDCFLKTSSTDVRNFLMLSQSPRNIKVSNRLWVSRASKDINTVFFAFDRREVIRNNSLLPNLNDVSIYDNAII